MTTDPTSPKLITFRTKIDVAKNPNAFIKKAPREGALFEYPLNTTSFQIGILFSITFYRIFFQERI